MKLMRIGSFSVAILLMANLFSFPSVLADNTSAGPAGDTQGSPAAMEYAAYLDQYKNADFDGKPVEIQAGDYADARDADVEELSSFEGKSNVLKWNSGGTVTWNFDAPTAGLYALKIEYYPLPGSGGDIQLSININGKQPYSQASLFTLHRIWVNKTSVRNDSMGNQIAPEQVESPRWNAEDFTDQQGYNTGALKLYLQQGQNSVSLALEQESLAISGLTFYTPDPVPSYAQTDKSLPDNSAKSGVIYVQGEDAVTKTSMMLHSAYDRTSPATMSASPGKIRQNVIGGETWNIPGQTLTWDFNVTADGYYKLAFRAQQNYLRGLFVTRTMLIDGKPAFEEAQNVKFDYNAGWFMKTVGDKDPYLFYLTKGKHTLSLMVSMGDVGPIVGDITSLVKRLNTVYQHITMVTGANPDPLRDYMLPSQVPDLVSSLKSVDTALGLLCDEAKALTGTTGSEFSPLINLKSQVDAFIANTDIISQRLTNFSNNISALGTLLLTLRQQSLMLDYFVLVPKDTPIPTGKSTLWADIKYNFLLFLNSFTSDYDKMPVGTTGKDNLNVWISLQNVGGTALGTSNIPTNNTSGGRDQAQILKVLVDSDFTPQYHIDVTLNTTQGAMINSILAGVAPDVTLMGSDDGPINMAMRGAAVALSDFSDFNDVASRFFPSSMTAYYYKGKCYALPEVQNFNMLFYRTDILGQLGLAPPKTWDDLFKMLPVLQRNNLNICIPTGDVSAQPIYETIMFQHGLSMYNKGQTATTFDQTEALDAFKFWTDFYVKYNIPQFTDFFNRFRTGEIPIGIAAYNMFNLLSIAAPELQGEWAMTTIPGYERPDGTVSIAEVSGGLNCLIVNGTKNKEGAWEFMKWWTSAQTQTRYGLEIESLLGPGGRYNTANIEAFNNLPWSKGTKSVLLQQWESIENNPQLPGTYYVARNLTNAFRAVVNNYANPRETLNKYNKYINDELTRKAAQFS